LIMMGDEDQIVPLINGKFLNSLIPNSRLKVIKGGGHLFLMAEADLCIRMIREFLQEQRVERKRAA
jgi:pimeloyl-ACP methyl ester carboxylesterase